MRRLASLVVSVVVLITTFVHAIPADAITPIPEPPCSAGGCFDITNAMAIVRHLSVDIGPRRVYDQRAIRARDYLSEAMSTFGLNVTLQQFPLPAGGSFWNVIGKPAPDTMEKGKYLLVGGHYDTVNGSPGANDNGTGTAAVIDIARAIAAQPAALPVVFVAFGAEEAQPSASSGRVGSKYFVSQMTAVQRSNLAALINLDYVGYGSGTKIRLRRISGTPDEATKRLQGLAAGLGVTAEVLNMDSSDDAPFAKAGMNAGSLRGMDDPNYHTQYDTYSRLKTPEFALAGRLAVAAVRSYSTSTATPPPPSTPPPSTPVWKRVQEGAATYSSGWTSASSSCTSGGAYRYSGTAGSTANFAFTGVGVRFVTAVGPNLGKVEVWLDSETTRTTVDTYATGQTCNVIKYERAESLSPGPHTLHLRVTGTTSGSGKSVVVDAFEYFS